MKIRNIVTVLGTCALLSACGGSDEPASEFSSDNPSALITEIAGAVANVGSSLTTTTGFRRASLTEDDCTEHADPASVSQSEGAYAGTLTYCKMTIDSGDPDSTQGRFAMIQKLSCAMNAAGIGFDGQDHSMEISSAGGCFTAEELEEMDGVTVKVTASQPASFNSHFDSGISIVIDSMGMSYKLGTKVTGETIEFASYEATEETGETGAFAGALDTSTGVLKVEARMHRIDCETSSRCGWNRHYRLFADMAVEADGSLGTIENMEFAYADIASPPGQNAYNGILVTAKGNMTDGIKARHWQATSDGAGAAVTAKTDYGTVSNWVEVPNTFCYTRTQDDASTCGSGDAGFTTNTYFTLYAASAGNVTSASDYFEGFDGLAFTSVSADKEAE